MKLFRNLILILITINLYACASNPNYTASKTINKAPSWFKKLPKSKKFIYTRGTAVSADMQIAYDKAKLIAKESLADQINSLISSKTKTFAKESGILENTQTYQELEKTTINTVKEAAVVGFKEYKSLTLPVNNKFRVYYVAKYPVNKSDKILMDHIKEKSVLKQKLQASDAYKQLEAEINSN